MPQGNGFTSTICGNTEVQMSGIQAGLKNNPTSMITIEVIAKIFGRPPYPRRLTVNTGRYHQRGCYDRFRRRVKKKILILTKNL
jgi:hypothetical protein